MFFPAGQALFDGIGLGLRGMDIDNSYGSTQAAQKAASTRFESLSEQVASFSG